jgi:glycosyltransferase involved in cell wall biosynthesis
MATCSLIIPVYNHASYLAACIDSALNQSVPFDEIVVVDDCSPDPAVRTLLARYVGAPGMRLYKNEQNLGITATQNFALSLCTSEYVAFLDCDDLLSKHARRAFDVYQRTQDADYFFSNRNEIGPNGELLRTVDVSKQIQEYDTLSQCLLEHMVATHFKVIRKSRLEEIGGFPGTSDGVQDWVVAVNIINNDNAVHIAEYVYSHRIHPGQTTAQDAVRYVAVVNAERERRLLLMGYKQIRRRGTVRKLAPYLSRVESLPRGAFLLRDGTMQPWIPAWIKADSPPEGCLLFYMPGHHTRVAQDFYLCKTVGAETVAIVDHKVPPSIALARWANAFFDHIVCLDAIARLAIEPWVADKTKIILRPDGDIRIKSPEYEAVDQVGISSLR